MRSLKSLFGKRAGQPEPIEKSGVESPDAIGHDEGRDKRQREVAALARLVGDPSVVEPLISASCHDQDWHVRRQAVKALRRFSDPRVTSPLVSVAVRDENPNVRRQAVETLRAIGDTSAVELVRELTSEQTGRALVVEPKTTSAPSDYDWHVRRAEVKALGKTGGTSAVETLIGALDDEDSRVRYQAVVALGNTGGPRAVEPLCAVAVHDEKRDVRLRAVDTLKTVDATRAVETLIRALSEDEPHMRLHAVQALERLGDTCAVEPLIGLLDDADWGVRHWTVCTLGTLGDHRAVLPLIDVLHGADSSLRDSAARALGSLGGDYAVENLRLVLHDEDKDVREAAAEALHRRPEAKRPQQVQSPDEVVAGIFEHGDDDEKVQASLTQLIEAGDEAVSSILAALRQCAAGKAPAPWWRPVPHLCEVLAQIGTDEAKQALVEVVSTDSQVAEWDQVRGVAAASVGSLHDTDLIPALTAALHEPHAPALAIQEAIVNLGGEVAESPEAIVQKGRYMELRESAEHFARHADSISSWTADERRAFYFTWAGTIRQLDSEGAALPYYAAALAADPDPLVMAWDYFPGVNRSPDTAVELAAKYPIPVPRSGASRPEAKQPAEVHEHEAKRPQQVHEGRLQAVYFPRDLVEKSPAAPTMNRIEELANADWIFREDWSVTRIQDAIEELDEVMRIGAPVWLSYPPINSAKVATLLLLMHDHDPRVASTAANALWQLLLTTATPAKVALLERIASRTDTEAKNKVAHRLLSDLMTSALGRDLETGEMESVTTLISMHL